MLRTVQKRVGAFLLFSFAVTFALSYLLTSSANLVASGLKNLMMIAIPRLDQPGFIHLSQPADRYVNTIATRNIDTLANKFVIGRSGHVMLLKDGRFVSSVFNDFMGKTPQEVGLLIPEYQEKIEFMSSLFGKEALFKAEKFNGFEIIGVFPLEEMYLYRNDILFWHAVFLLLLAIFVFTFMSVAVNQTVVRGIRKMNKALQRIEAGYLEEKVNIRTNKEFSALSDGINSMVSALAQASNRISHELNFARRIQKSSLPGVFPPFPKHTAEAGYSPREIFERTNKDLCDNMDTDGVTEAENEKHEFFGVPRLQMVLNQHRDDDAKVLVEAVKNEVSSFSGNADQSDDITLLAFRFLVKSITVPATPEHQEELMDFVTDFLYQHSCSKDMLGIAGIVIDEIFSNVAKYAYAPGTGELTVYCSIGGDPKTLTLRFVDCGKPFDPFTCVDPDTSTALEDREVGSLGLYIVKSLMDDVGYEYQDGENILTLQKHLTFETL